MRVQSLISIFLLLISIPISAQNLTSSRIGVEEIAKAREGIRNETFTSTQNVADATLLGLEFLTYFQEYEKQMKINQRELMFNILRQNINIEKIRKKYK